MLIILELVLKKLFAYQKEIIVFLLVLQLSRKFARRLSNWSLERRKKSFQDKKLFSQLIFIVESKASAHFGGRGAQMGTRHGLLKKKKQTEI